MELRKYRDGDKLVTYPLCANFEIDVNNLNNWNPTVWARDVEAILTKLTVENKKLKEALGFYGKEENYDNADIANHCDIREDRGQRARAALKGSE